MIALPWRWLTGALAIFALLSGTWWKGNQHGQATVQQAWDNEKAAAADQRREDAKKQRQASAGYQVQLQQINARAVSLQGKLHDALAQPIPTCPATVGALVVPATAIDSLRAAGADPSP